MGSLPDLTPTFVLVNDRSELSNLFSIYRLFAPNCCVIRDFSVLSLVESFSSLYCSSRLLSLFHLFYCLTRRR